MTDCAGALEQPPAEALDLVEVLQALADPVRLQIVRHLAGSDGSVACNQIPIPVGKSTGSHHLKVLREAGIVRIRVEGTRKFPSLRRDELEARFPGLLDSVLRAGRDPSGSDL